MRNLYKAKHYFEEVLLGSNLNGLGFINESASYFEKAYGFDSYFGNDNYSNDVLTVGLISNDSVLEVGVDTETIGTRAYCDCLKDDICRKLMLSQKNVVVIPTKKYNAHLNLGSGDKIGHLNLAFSNSYGTLGFFLLPHIQNQNPHIVSNNHVLADTNNGQFGDAIYSMKAPISQVGKLKHYVPITTTGNTLDLAVAELQGFKRTTSVYSKSYRKARIGEKVYKNGATTGKTTGFIRSLNYSSKINYGGVNAVFVDQIQITGIPGKSFSKGGDSGSLIRSSSDNTFLGLLFAGNGTWTLANHQPLVVRQLKQWGYSIK